MLAPFYDAEMCGLGVQFQKICFTVYLKYTFDVCVRLQNYMALILVAWCSEVMVCNVMLSKHLISLK